MNSHWSLRRFYLYLNRKWFDGDLPSDTVVTWEPCVNAHGQCHDLGDGKFHIKIDTSLKGLHEFMLITLLHEMAHVKVWDAKHGRKWRGEMRRLAAAGAFDDLW